MSLTRSCSKLAETGIPGSTWFRQALYLVTFSSVAYASCFTLAITFFVVLSVFNLTPFEVACALLTLCLAYAKVNKIETEFILTNAKEAKERGATKGA